MIFAVYIVVGLAWALYCAFAPLYAAVLEAAGVVVFVLALVLAAAFWPIGVVTTLLVWYFGGGTSS